MGYPKYSKEHVAEFKTAARHLVLLPKRSTERIEFRRQACQKIAEATGRKLSGVESTLHNYARGRFPGGQLSETKVRRGSRLFSPKGLRSLRANGTRRWAVVKENLKSMGLTDEQIALAFRPRKVTLPKNLVASIEAALVGKDSMYVHFRKTAMGYWTAVVVPKPFAAPAPVEEPVAA